MIFANYEYLLSTYAGLISIYITFDPTQGYTITCDPYSRARIERQVTITSNTTIQTNTWMHFACISDKDNTQTMTSIIYNSQSMSESTGLTANAYVVTISEGFPIMTYFGNSVDLTNLYKGLMREFRIFNTTLSFDQIRAMRQYKTP